MPSYDFQLSDYRIIIIRQFRFIFMFVAAVIVAGFFVGRSLPRTYRATVILQVDFDNYFEGVPVDPVVMNSMQENLATIMTDITGLSVLLRAVRIMGRVYDTVSLSGITREILDTVEAYREKITLSPQADAKQIEIAAVADNPGEAAAVADAVGEAYQAVSYDIKKSRFDRRELKIRETLERCTNELSTLAQRMIEVRGRRRHLIDEKYDAKREEQTAVLDHKLQEAEYLLATISALRKELHDLHGRLERSKRQSTGGAGDSIAWLPDLEWMNELLYRDPGLESLNRRLIELRDERYEYLRYYRTSHPKIADINDRLVQTIDEINRALDRNEAALQQNRRQAVAHQDRIAEELGDRHRDESALYRLQRRYASQQEWCETIEGELRDVQAAAAGLIPFVSIAVRAKRPESPEGFGMRKIMVLSLVIGLALGILLSILREMADRSLGTVEDVRRVLPGCVVLAVIPRIEAVKEGVRETGESKVVFQKYYKELLPVLFGPGEPGADPFLILGAQLGVTNVHHALKTILVTSSINQEGKTIVAANLAIALARQGKQVALVEADFRRPSMSPLFGLPELPGLMHILIEAKTADECKLTVADLVTGTVPTDEIIKAHGIDTLAFIPFGSFPPNPAELLASPAMHRLLRELAGEYDTIILDSPPVLPVTDPVLLARWCDGTIVVYRSDKAPREALTSAMRRLEKAGTPVLGLVLNRWRISAADAGGDGTSPGAPV